MTHQTLMLILSIVASSLQLANKAMTEVQRNPDGTLTVETERDFVKRGKFRVSQNRKLARWELLFYDTNGEIKGERHFPKESQARHYVAFLRKKPGAGVQMDLFPLN